MKRGFTLLEITVAVAVVTVLTVIAVLSFSKHRSEAQKAVCASQRNSIAIAAEHWLSKTGRGKTAPKLEDLVEEEGTGYFKESPRCPCAGSYTITLDENTKAIMVACSYEEHGGQAGEDGEEGGGSDDESEQTVTIAVARTGGWSLEGNAFKPAASSQISTYNANSDDGLFELEPNSEYEFTIEVPSSLWDASKGEFMQTVVRVYSDYDGLNENGKKKENAASIVCGASTAKAETDPGGIGYIGDEKGGVSGATGYNTGSSGAKKAGYSAEATMATVGNVVRTTITLTTGDAGGKFGANFLSTKTSTNWNTNSQLGRDRRAAAETAIQNATLTKVK